jgi:hypothetical protein
MTIPSNCVMRILRIAFFVYVAVFVVIWIVGLEPQLIATQSPCTSQCAQVRLSADDFTQLVASGTSPAFYATYMTTIIFLLDTLLGSVIAMLLVLRRPNDGVAFLLAVPMISHSLNYMDHPGFVQQQYPWLWFLTMLPNVAIATLWLPAFSVLPDGNWVPRWSRWLIPYIVAIGIFTYVGAFFLPFGVWNQIAGAAFLANFPVAIGFQVWRFVRASSNERARLKWVLVGFFISFTVPVLLRAFKSIAPDAFHSGSPLWLASQPLAISSPILQYLCIGIAILHSRLFDVDILIRRTLIYSILTALLALFYFGSVVVLQQLFRVMSGAGGDLAIIVSTLAIAALFVPLRHRVQDIIDRRFYRRKYDAQQVLARFVATARDQVELEKLTGELLNVVSETMQPASVSLWLRAPEGKRQ